MATEEKSSMTAKPATPLPWVAQGALGQVSGRIDPVCRTERHLDAAYIIAACNAYPRLLEDRRRLAEALRNLMNASAAPTYMQAEHYEAFLRASKLLRDLEGQP